MNVSTILFVGGMPGGMELAIILLLVILLFGADKLPKLARSTGQAMGEFQKGREDIEREIRESARATEERHEAERREAEADRNPEFQTETERLARSG